MKKEISKTVNETCANCGYPYNGTRKHCKVCGIDLRENKKVEYKVLSPAKIVSHVLVAVALVLAIVGIFGAVVTNVFSYGDYKFYEQTGIAYFFKDGWKMLFDSFGTVSFSTDATRFIIEFLAYIFALVGIICLLIIFIQTLVSRYRAKQTKFCVCKFFKFQVLFLLPYVFAINFFVTNYTASTKYSSTYLGGWGVMLIAISLLVGFIASCINHIGSDCKKPTDGPFAVKQIATFLLVFVGIYGFMAISKFRGLANTDQLALHSIYTLIELFVRDTSIPMVVGVSLIMASVLFSLVLVLIIAFVFTKNDTRKIIYSGVAFVLTIIGVILNYYGCYQLVDFYGALEEVCTGLTCGAICAQVFGLASLLLAISYKCVSVKRTRLARK